MALRLQIVSHHRQKLGERGCKEFGQNGGTIGRSLECDWALPDGLRFMSSRHASIDFRSGSYYIVDTSTNGVFINDSEQPVGKGNPQRLFSGDRIRIADYEILVEIDEDRVQEQPAGARHVDPVDLKQRVEAPEPMTHDLIDAVEVTGIGVQVILEDEEASTIVPVTYGFKADELRLEDDVAAARARAAKPAARSTPNRAAKRAAATAPNHQPKPAVGPASSRDPKPAAHPAPNPAPKPAAGTAPSNQPRRPVGAAAPPSTLDAFFRGAGLQPRALDAKQADEMLHRIGQLIREMLAGLTENLHLRAAQKSALRQSNTTVQPSDNNSLKFSAGADEALQNLLFRESAQYLNAVESVRDAFGDIKVHQQALLKAMQGAVADCIGRLDPEQLEEKFSNGRHGLLAGAANKLKYWDLYKDLYQVVAQRNAGGLPRAFVEQVAEAYELETTRAAAERSGHKLKFSA